ncbi:MAG: sulfotransferase [Hydrococcus sp. RU_2_2]|nr:sulfotransferase [Hydrococcus sp. RU_2_2]
MTKPIKQLAKTAIYNYYSFSFDKIQHPNKILLILGHMRAGSSLLTHILNTNPEISGFGESHLRYATGEDFKELIYQVHRTLNKWQPSEKYVLDKVLHDSYLIDENLLISNKICAIFLIREPKETLPSLIKINPHKKWDEIKALRYYTERLENLEKYARLINNKNRALAVTYEQIIENTEQVFKTIEKFLDLKNSLSEQYEILPTTGTLYVGDSSENIKTGSIVRKKYKSPDIEISPKTLERAFDAFNQCHATLSQYCSTPEI